MQFPPKEIVTIFYRYFVLFLIIISIIYKLWVGPTWPIWQTTTSNALNFEPCLVSQKYLVSCAGVARSQNPNQPNLMNNYKNFMHSIIDETFKYLFSLFGQGLASERSHPNSRMIILHLFQPVYSFNQLLCWPNNWNDKLCCAVCVSVLSWWRMCGGMRMNGWAKIKQKWGKLPSLLPRRQ
jgi:hypothetical protein